MPVDTGIYSGLLAPPRSSLDYANQYADLGLLPLKRQLMESQVQDALSNNALRASQVQVMQRNQSMIENLLNPQGSQPQTTAPMFPARQQLAQASALGLPPGPTTAAAALPMPQAPASAPIAPRFGGVDPQAIGFDIAMNGGKGVGSMINDRTKPNWDIVNGVPIDKNHLTPGMTIPQISQDGKASQLIPDPTVPGGYRVIAPQGALDTFAGYQNAGEAAKAKYDLVDVYDPMQKRMVKVPRSALVGAPQPPQPIIPGSPVMRPQPAQTGNPLMYPGQTVPVRPGEGYSQPTPQATTAEQLKIMLDEFNNEKDPANKAAIAREMRALAGGSAPVSNAAGPSAGEKATSDAQAKYEAGAATNFADEEKNINDKVSAGRELVLRLAQQEEAMKNFRPGATGPMRAAAAAYAKDLGAPDNVVKGIGGGDPAAAQEFTKFAAQTNLEQLKQAIGANRMLKTEFDAFQAANPSIASDPAAIGKVFDWIRQTYKRDYAQQQALAQFKKSGEPMSNFPAWYSAQQHARLPGMTEPDQAPQAAAPNDLAAAAARELSRRYLMNRPIESGSGQEW